MKGPSSTLVLPETQSNATPGGNGKSQRSRRDSVSIARSKYDDWVAKKKKLSQDVLHPNNSTFLPQWDIVVGIALLFTATVTPFEVAFLGSGINALFVINRLFDLVFITDIWVNFHLAYFDNKHRVWVTEKAEIWRHYAKGWLAIDILSTIPYDLADFVVPSDGGGSPQQLKVLRILKILKLVKLLRMLKGAQVFYRIQSEFEISNANAALIQYAVGMSLLVHWIACLWGLGPSFNEYTWAHARGPADGLRFVDSPAADMYILCVYYAVQSIVMGESEDHLPVNTSDRVLAVACMLLGGTIYAYVIGSICSILAMRDPASREFKESCDLVAKFAHENELPKDLETNLKEYFMNSEQLFRNRMYKGVYDNMTPSLQRRIAVSMHGGWLKTIPFFTASDRDERESFVAVLSTLLEPCTFPPHEEIYRIGQKSTFMMIVTRGIATSAGPKGTAVFHQGDHFGEEMILRFSTRISTVRAISYMNANKLPSNALEDFLEHHPEAFPQTIALIRKTKVKMALRRAMMKLSAMLRLAMQKHKWTPEEAQRYKAELKRKAEDFKKRFSRKVEAGGSDLLKPKAEQTNHKKGGYSLITGDKVENEPQTFGEYRQEFAVLTTPTFAAKIETNIVGLAKEYAEVAGVPFDEQAVQTKTKVGTVGATSSSGGSNCVQGRSSPVGDLSPSFLLLSSSPSPSPISGGGGAGANGQLGQILQAMQEQLSRQELAMENQANALAAQSKMLAQQNKLLQSMRQLPCHIE
jgi:CRP-like cAMP-binding protein